MSLFQDDHFLLLKSLLSHNVRFIVISGHAAIYHGVRRSTGDRDMLIEPTSANGLLLITALGQAGLEVPEIEPHEFESRIVLSFGVEPEAVDILDYTPGINFAEAYRKLRGVGFFREIIDLRDLIANKEALRRPGEKALLDQYDLEVLKKILRQKGGDR